MTKLDTIDDIKREMIRIYTLIERDRIDIATANKQTSILESLIKIIEISDLEKRIEALENQK